MSMVVLGNCGVDCGLENTPGFKACRKRNIISIS